MVGMRHFSLSEMTENPHAAAAPTKYAGTVNSWAFEDVYPMFLMI